MKVKMFYSALALALVFSLASVIGVGMVQANDTGQQLTSNVETDKNPHIDTGQVARQGEVGGSDREILLSRRALDQTLTLIPTCDPNVELVINGGFETPVVTHTKLWNIFNSSQVTGWTIEWVSTVPSTYGGYDRPDDAYLELHAGVNGWAPHEGEQYAELDADWDGPDGSLTGEPASVSIYQDISTIPGETYTISFYFSPRPSTDISNNVLEFSWCGDVKDTISAAGSSNTVWSYHTYSYVAGGSTCRLQFSDNGTSDSLGTFLDDVSVRCVTTTPTPTPTPRPTYKPPCFIATAAYGTSSAKEIDTLRAFRDDVLLESVVGSQLVEWYYQTSPPVADFISQHEVLRTLVRDLAVDPISWVVQATGNLWRD